MKKLLSKLTVTTLSLLFIFSGSMVFATEKNESEVYTTVVPEIVVEGRSEKLYKELENQELALEQFLEDNKELLSNIANEYGIEMLYKDNWKQYQEIAHDKYSENFSNSYYKRLVSFFDIYENKYKNQEIKDKVSKNDLTRLEFMLPIQSFYATNKLDKYVDLDKIDLSNLIKSKEIGGVDRATNLPDMSAAIKYAEKYAEDPNKSEYHYFHRGDCANFVSQILEAGGIKQEVYPESWKGWWHTTGNFHIPFIGSEHKHSEAWSMADTFARYMGVSSMTSDHKSFSASINKGTIIAADFDDDGDWDHIAFVTDADNYVGSYDYYDYKVAQHTSNYLAWTSTDRNGWENIGGNGGKYATIRQ